MQQHTAQHLLSAIAGRVARVDTVKWEFFPDSVVVDFVPRSNEGDDGLPMPPLQSLIDQVEESTNEAIRAAAAVSWRLVAKEDLDQYPQARGEVKGAALEMQHLRLIFIEGIDANPCGGRCTRTAGICRYKSVKHARDAPGRYALAIDGRDSSAQNRRLRKGQGRHAAALHQRPPLAAASCEQHGT